jgi:hypothetical protein
MERTLPARRRAEGERPLAGPLEARRAVAPGEREQAEAGAVAHLGVRVTAERRVNQLASGLADLRRPTQEPPGRPLEVGAVV